MPTMGHRTKTKHIPPKNATIPRMRSFREKKRIVREGPMVKVRPVKKSTSPKANNAESKNNSTPRIRNMQPKNRRPVPIFVLSLIIF
mmetsp:Transcript_33237/g.38477  ORF Transcript_33237/g.38477 Transcript_33237/m.38477 type:complete len:87 (+) Transcript_33237:392-652(+)